MLIASVATLEINKYLILDLIKKKKSANCHQLCSNIKSPLVAKGQEKRGTFLPFNLWRNIVALQVERVVARITIARSTFHVTNFSVTSCDMLRKVDPSSTFYNKFST